MRLPRSLPPPTTLFVLSDCSENMDEASGLRTVGRSSSRTRSSRGVWASGFAGHAPVSFRMRPDANRTIQSLWIGPKFSAMEQLSVASFLANGHEYHLYAYDEVRNVPPGVVMMDAGEVLPESSAFQLSTNATWAGFADFFRYKLLLERGGWWADTDLVCVRPFDFTDQYVFSSEFSNGRLIANIGAIKVPVGSELMSYMWAVCQTKDPAKLVWGETGPALMNEAVERFSIRQYVKPYGVFCPIGFHEWRAFLDPDRAEPSAPETYAIHLWHEMWRLTGQDRDRHYHPACIYERLRRRYLGGEERISLETVRAILENLNNDPGRAPIRAR